MTKNRIILVLIACFPSVLLTTQIPSFTTRRFPPRKPGMTKEEYRKDIEKVVEQRKEQERKIRNEHIKAMFPPAWKGLLRISDKQWKLIEPKVNKIQVIGWTTCACAAGCGGIEDFHWYKHSEGTHITRAKTPHEMIEGERLADELVNLLEDENSKDEQIRKKIDSLQQVRENARKELHKAQKELAEVLTTPRQEAIFLITGYID
jgi:hypothetical protein